MFLLENAQIFGRNIFFSPEELGRVQVEKMRWCHHDVIILFIFCFGCLGILGIIVCLLNLVLWGQLLFYYSLWYNFLSYTNNVVLGYFC